MHKPAKIIKKINKGGIIMERSVNELQGNIQEGIYEAVLPGAFESARAAIKSGNYETAAIMLNIC